MDFLNVSCVQSNCLLLALLCLLTEAKLCLQYSIERRTYTGARGDRQSDKHTIFLPPTRVEVTCRRATRWNRMQCIPYASMEKQGVTEISLFVTFAP